MDGNFSVVVIDTRINLPLNCRDAGFNGNSSYFDWVPNVGLPTATNESYMGGLTEFHTGFDYEWLDESDSSFKTNSPGCPSLILYFGYARVSNDTNTLLSPQSDATTMACYQLM